MAKNEKSYSLHKVEGFNPYDYRQESKNRKTGEPIVLDDGTKLEHITTLAKIAWLQMFYPEAAMAPPEVEITPISDYARLVGAKAAFYKQPNDINPIGAAAYYVTVWDDAELDKTINYAIKTAEAQALTKAISSEAELLMKALPEGELPDDIAPVDAPTKEVIEKKRRGRPKKVVDVSPEPEEEVGVDIAGMLAAAEEKAKAEVKPVEEEEPAESEEDAKLLEEIEKAKATILTVKDENNVKNKGLISYIGMSIGEIMTSFDDFCKLVVTRPSVSNEVTEEVMKAASFIYAHRDFMNSHK